MSDHLLECPSSNTCECNMGPVHKDSCPQRKKCICTELRACQERVWKSAHLEEDALIQVVWQEALQAARDAVAALPQRQSGIAMCVERNEALAAIDNLITKNSGENYE